VLAELMRAHRRSKGLTQEALAEAAGVSVRCIRKIESGGVRVPRPSTLNLLARALGLTETARTQVHRLAAGGPVMDGPLVVAQGAFEDAVVVLPRDVLRAALRDGEGSVRLRLCIAPASRSDQQAAG